jgi:hypothetical protein
MQSTSRKKAIVPLVVIRDEGDDIFYCRMVGTQKKGQYTVKSPKGQALPKEDVELFRSDPKALFAKYGIPEEDFRSTSA